MKIYPRKNGNPAPVPVPVIPEVVPRHSAILEQPITMHPFEFIEMLVSFGLPLKEIAEYLGCSPSWLGKLIRDNPALKNIVDNARRRADLMVVNALLRRAVGYNYVEVMYDRYGAEIKRHYKHLPPDPTSIIFYLKNRLPDEFQDKYHKEITLKDRMAVGHEHKP